MSLHFLALVCDACGERSSLHKCPGCDLFLCDAHRECPECETPLDEPYPEELEGTAKRRHVKKRKRVEQGKHT